MNQPINEGDLARLIREAADQTQPRPALDAIRARTASTPKESAMSLARTWILGGLGGAVATAAVIGGVYVATTSGDGDSQEPGPVDTPSVSESVEPSPSEPTDPTPSETDSSEPPTPPGGTVPVYYAGETPAGTRLYREFVSVTAEDRLVAGLQMATVKPSGIDPDYTTLWPAGTEVESARSEETGGDTMITISLGGDLHDRPAGMSEREAQLAIEQLIYTAQGVVQKGRVPVQFLLDGKHTDQVLGQPASEPLANGPVLQTLALVNVSSPSDGDEVSGDTLEVSGVANSFEANVTVKLQRYEGTHVVFQDFITAEGWMGEKLFPFAKSFDISDVPAGKYILTVSTDDPSDGEGPGPHADSKTVEIR